MRFSKILPLIHCCSALLHWLIHVTSPPQFTMHSWFCAIQPWVQAKSGFLNNNQIPSGLDGPTRYGPIPEEPWTYSQFRGVPETFSTAFDHATVVRNGIILFKIILNYCNAFVTCRNCITPRSSLIFAKNKIYIHLRMSSTKYDLDAFRLISSEYL